MSEFQNVHFKTVDEFLRFLPEEESKIVLALRSLVQDCIPDVKERLAYNVPYYYRYSRICFIWPASVPWGKRQEKSGVEFGFCSGHLLSDASYLDKGNRKEVYIKTFQSVREIDGEALRQLLYEAVSIDEAGALLKKDRKRLSN
jgi:hypothetical protein